MGGRMNPIRSIDWSFQALFLWTLFEY